MAAKVDVWFLRCPHAKFRKSAKRKTSQQRATSPLPFLPFFLFLCDFAVKMVCRSPCNSQGPQRNTAVKMGIFGVLSPAGLTLLIGVGNKNFIAPNCSVSFAWDRGYMGFWTYPVLCQVRIENDLRISKIFAPSTTWRRRLDRGCPVEGKGAARVEIRPKPETRRSAN